MITQNRLKKLMHYDPDTGIFIWIKKSSKFSHIHLGDVAGSVAKDGYCRTTIDGENFMVHRLAWFYVTGWWPKDEIDHKNTIRYDNSFDNLREATPVFNQQNLRKAPSTSITGVLGANKNDWGFRSRIRANGKIINLGSYATAEAAHAEYVKAKRKLHPGCTL